ncbi:replication protein [Lysobacter sp. HDW10]|uniref:replication initiation factor domain-containing protein n=1 Tax=Lysobacter sp. HDW10 TaxID=2714936 RepID=UPI00140A2DBB|nr:replication initiation factor domain-containing protein [Lysobacter sp. HDW10]QIK81677.1 replication protein [Lysobacter sp. HDW10]
MFDAPNLNTSPHTGCIQGDAGTALTGLPLSNRGVDSPEGMKTWAGIDWVAGSVDLFDVLREVSDTYSWRDLETIGEHLKCFGPKPKPKGSEADENGELVVGSQYVFVPADANVRACALDVFQYFFEGCAMQLSRDAGPGKFYAYRYMLRNLQDQPCGMIELGGSLTLRKDTGRPSVRIELTGLGCSLFEQRGNASADHAQLWCAFRAKLERVGAQLTRVDVAYDDFLGVNSVKHAECMWDLGEFDYKFGPEMKRPEAKEFNDKGSGKGCTFYVGNSSSEKQLRVYEKGKQLGDRESPWVRWELQFRSSTRKKLSLDILTDPMAYMRGAFECLDFVASCMKRLEVTGEASKACIKSVMRHARRMYGATFHQLRLLAPDRESFLQLIERLETEKVPRWAKTGRPTWDDVFVSNDPTESSSESST